MRDPAASSRNLGHIFLWESVHRRPLRKFAEVPFYFRLRKSAFESSLGPKGGPQPSTVDFAFKANGFVKGKFAFQELKVGWPYIRSLLLREIACQTVKDKY